jgi:hypothetical protein
MIKALFALALVACATGPEARGIEVSDIYKVYNQDKAMFLAQTMVEDHYDVRYGNLFLDTTVYWADTKCPYSDEYAVVHEGKCYHGKMWSCGEMYVAISSLGTTGYTALLHEFGHCLYMEQIDPNHLGCPDHSDAAFWSIIGAATAVSRDRGW